MVLYTYTLSRTLVKQCLNVSMYHQSPPLMQEQIINITYIAPAGGGRGVPPHPLKTGRIYFYLLRTDIGRY